MVIELDITEVDSEAAAEAAGLRYVTDEEPGYRRLRAGSGFRYVDANGERVTSERTLARIKSLVIPPAWTDIWICASANGHLQATGRDAKGRKQYRYHPKWRERRDQSKYDHMIAFGRALPSLRETVADNLAKPGIEREKVLAAVVRLLETTLIRIGNEEYARTNHSFGLTTLRDRHVDVNGSSVRFHFRGKSGIDHDVDVQDPKLARIVKRCRDLPGQMLFQYQNGDGERRPVTSGDVNNYLRSVTNENFTAKDFRTWAGTLLALESLCSVEPDVSESERKRILVQTIDEVAAQLGNTRAVCRKCYIHPAVIDAFLAGELPTGLCNVDFSQSASSQLGLSSSEQALLNFLEDQQSRN
ncbi:MAG: DNA topoisomerase IB [Thermomicrobiales bacterium]